MIVSSCEKALWLYTIQYQVTLSISQRKNFQWEKAEYRLQTRYFLLSVYIYLNISKKRPGHDVAQGSQLPHGCLIPITGD
jgi:hypothetical protein